MPKSKIHWCERNPLNTPYLTLCLSPKQFKRVLKYSEIEDDVNWISQNADATTHLYTKPSKRLTIVCIDVEETPTLVELVGLLAHEATHVWQGFRDSIGEDNPSSEFEAYCVQHFTQQLLHAYIKQGGTFAIDTK